MANEQNNSPITQTEVDSFAQKLEQWGTGLPAKEQALLHLMVARATAVGASDLEAHEDGTTPFRPIHTSVNGLFSPLLVGHGGGLAASGWVQAGDPWVQGSGRSLQQFINPNPAAH